jgi:hypothetical protein
LWSKHHATWQVGTNILDRYAAESPPYYNPQQNGMNIFMFMYGYCPDLIKCNKNYHIFLDNPKVKYLRTITGKHVK